MTAVYIVYELPQASFIEQQLLEMEFKRNSAIALYLAGKSQPVI